MSFISSPKTFFRFCSDKTSSFEPENSSDSIKEKEESQKNDVFLPPKDIQPKKVEKIVTFYSDKTFTEYFPE